MAGANLSVKRYRTATLEGNSVFGGRLDLRECGKVNQKDNHVTKTLTGASARKVQPNRYDPKRAHIVVLNGRPGSPRSVDVSDVLKGGDRYRLMDPERLYGKPVREGVCGGKTISVTTDGAFGVFVLMKQ